MKRRGQLLSIDALLSLVIVVMVVGVVMNTNDMIKAEITGLLDWYDRANIANNMLDVLTKNPGYPGDWEEDAADVKVVGLRDNTYSFALDYDKIIALNRSKDNLNSIFNQLAREKDFLFEVYVSNITLNISGRFPRVYLNNITFSDLGPGTETVNFVISTDSNLGMDPDPFSVSYIKLWHNDQYYFNEEICPLIGGNRIDLNQGDYLKFVIEEPVYLVARRAEREEYLIPANSIIELYIDVEVSKGFSMNFGKGNCSPENIRFSLTGHGSLIITVSAYDSTFPTLNFTYRSARNLFDLDNPLYRIAMINETFESNMDTIKSSMNRSPWIQPAERLISVTKRIYNLSGAPSSRDPIVYGIMERDILEDWLLKIRVNSTDKGNLTLISTLEDEKRGLFVYRNNTALNATLVWFVNGQGKAKSYESINNIITIPLKDFLGTTETENKFVGVWLYSLSDSWKNNVQIEIVPSIDHILGPKIDEVLIQLLVWDDR